MYRIALIAAAVAVQAAMGTDRVTKLECASARGTRTEAVMELAPGDTYIVNVVFVGKSPPAREIDRILRDCVAAAVRRDGTRDILASPWLRKKAGDRHSSDELLHPYDGMQYLAYDARSRTTAIRDSKQ